MIFTFSLENQQYHSFLNGKYYQGGLWGENHYGQFIGNKLEIFDFRVYFVCLIAGLKIEEVISGHSEHLQHSN